MSAIEPKTAPAAEQKPGFAPRPALPYKPLSSFEGGSNVVFFGNSLPVECQRCGAFCGTNMGHKYCSHVTCPIALKEFKRRRRKRTSTLEQVYIPTRFGKKPSEAPPAPSEPASDAARASTE